MSERRAPVQGNHRLPRGTQGRAPGTISWEEHLEAWRAYAREFPGQNAERIAERGGFGYGELVEYLKRPPTTWEPHAP